MPVAMSVVWDIVKNPVKSKQLADLLLDFDRVLGINIDKTVEKKNEDVPQEILELVEQRKLAKANKDWTLADEIRNKIQEKGYSIKDTKTETIIEKI